MIILGPRRIEIFRIKSDPSRFEQSKYLKISLDPGGITIFDIKSGPDERSSYLILSLDSSIGENI